MAVSRRKQFLAYQGAHRYNQYIIQDITLCIRLGEKRRISTHLKV